MNGENGQKRPLSDHTGEDDSVKSFHTEEENVCRPFDKFHLVVFYSFFLCCVLLR